MKQGNKKRIYLNPSEEVCPVCGSKHIQNIARIT